ncbi:myozenin-2a [Salminus brasiliensis]|uniref:myozenin-2a n=1 Tax=Salminus brasiliensis TaxID=930266 RepID=UPI003B838256
MSQQFFMTTRERKMQAAAICKEIRGTDESEVDVGRKVNAPKEIMLEELSLASNRGSRLFKMRQKRSEKYTFESIQNKANAQINTSVIPPVPGTETNVNGLGDDQPPSNTPTQSTNPDFIAPGYGGPLKDIPAEKFNCTAIPKSYLSPWDLAISTNPSLADTLHVPEPEPRPDIEYKSFNRVATPFGGFGKAPKVPVKAVKDDVVKGIASLPPPAPLADPVSTRPTFNRTALGWVAESAPLVLPTVSLETMSSVPPVFIPESDEL